MQLCAVCWLRVCVLLCVDQFFVREMTMARPMARIQSGDGRDRGARMGGGKGVREQRRTT